MHAQYSTNNRTGDYLIAVTQSSKTLGLVSVSLTPFCTSVSELEAVCRYHFAPLSTRYITNCAFTPEITDNSTITEIVRSALRLIFTAALPVVTVVLALPPGAFLPPPLAPLLRPLASAAPAAAPVTVGSVFASVRSSYVLPTSIRPAVVGDTDAVAAVIGQERVEALEQEFGKFVLSRLINAPGNGVFLVAETRGVVVAAVHATLETPDLFSDYDLTGLVDGSVALVGLMACADEVAPRLPEILAATLAHLPEAVAVALSATPQALRGEFGPALPTIAQLAVRAPPQPTAAPADSLLVLPLSLVAGSTAASVRPVAPADAAALAALAGEGDEDAFVARADARDGQTFVLEVAGSVLGSVALHRVPVMSAGLLNMNYIRCHFDCDHLLRNFEGVINNVFSIDVFCISPMIAPLARLFLTIVAKLVGADALLRTTPAEIDVDSSNSDIVLAKALRRSRKIDAVRVLPPAPELVHKFNLQEMPEDDDDAVLNPCIRAAKEKMRQLAEYADKRTDFATRSPEFAILCGTVRSLCTPPATIPDRVVIFGQGAALVGALDELLCGPLPFICDLTVISSPNLPSAPVYPSLEHLDVRSHARVIESGIARINPTDRYIELANGECVVYDKLLLAPTAVDDTLSGAAGADLASLHDPLVCQCSTHDDTEMLRLALRRMHEEKQNGIFDTIRTATVAAAAAVAAGASGEELLEAAHEAGAAGDAAEAAVSAVERAGREHGAALRPNVYSNGQVVIVSNSRLGLELLQVALSENVSPEDIYFVTSSQNSIVGLGSQTIAEALFTRIENLGIKTYSGSLISETRSWAGRVNSVRLEAPSPPQLVIAQQAGDSVSISTGDAAGDEAGRRRANAGRAEIPCSLIATANPRELLPELQRDFKDESDVVIHDSRIIVDNFGRTPDHSVYAHGECVGFSRGLFAQFAHSGTALMQFMPLITTSTANWHTTLPDPARASQFGCGRHLIDGFWRSEGLVGANEQLHPFDVTDYMIQPAVMPSSNTEPEVGAEARRARQQADKAMQRIVKKIEDSQKVESAVFDPVFPPETSLPLPSLQAAQAVSVTTDLVIQLPADPIVELGRVPGGHLLTATLPNSPDPVVWREDQGFGYLLSTGCVEQQNDQPYVEIHVIGDGTIHSVSCLLANAPSQDVVARLALLPGLPITILGDVRERISQSNITCLLDYITNSDIMKELLCYDIREHVAGLVAMSVGSTDGAAAANTVALQTMNHDPHYNSIDTAFLSPLALPADVFDRSKFNPAPHFAKLVGAAAAASFFGRGQEPVMMPAEKSLTQDWAQIAVLSTEY